MLRKFQIGDTPFVFLSKTRKSKKNYRNLSFCISDSEVEILIIHQGVVVFFKLCLVIQSFGVDWNYVHSLYILRSLDVVIEMGIQFKHSLSKAYNKEKLCN